MSASENLPQSGNGKLPQPPSSNKLEMAVADYHLLEQQVDSLNDQVKTYSDLSIRLQAENDAQRNQIREQAEFYSKQLATITNHRDRLERLLKGLLTRFKVIRECFAQAEAEAHLEAMKAPAPAGSALGAKQAAPHTTALPANEIG